MIKKAKSFVKTSKKDYSSSSYNIQYEVKPEERINSQGRFPANVILDDSEVVRAGFPNM